VALLKPYSEAEDSSQKNSALIRPHNLPNAIRSFFVARGWFFLGDFFLFLFLPICSGSVVAESTFGFGHVVEESWRCLLDPGSHRIGKRVEKGWKKQPLRSRKAGGTTSSAWLADGGMAEYLSEGHEP